MESFVALTRFQAGRPRFKGEERQRELVWRQMVVCFPWQQQRGESLVSASSPCWQVINSPEVGGAELPGAPSSQQGSETEGSEAATAQAGLHWEPPTPTPSSGTGWCPAEACLGWQLLLVPALLKVRANSMWGRAKWLIRGSRTNDLQRELCGFERHNYQFKPRSHNTAPLQNIMKVNN